MNKLKKTIAKFILVATCICIGMPNTYITQALEISKNNYERVNANLSNEPNKSAPEIEYITPVSGPETGGNYFAIRGKNFVQGTIVTIGGKPVQNIKISGSFLLEGQVPAGKLGKVDVVVTNPDGQSYVKEGGYEYVPPMAAPPKITGITPSIGSEAGGNIIDIEGKDFVDGLKVRFSTPDNYDTGGILGEVTFVNSTLVRVKVPAGTGEADVKLINPDGQLDVKECGYKYVKSYAAPEIEYITPVSGPETGGNYFAIRGKNFVQGTTVTIGGKLVENIKISGSFLLEGQVPAGKLGKVDVVVTNPDGQSYVKEGGYEYVPPVAAPPKITGITPAIGSEAGGNIIDIEGKNFVDGLKVRFSTPDNYDTGGILGEVTFVNSTLVRVKVPAGTGEADVKLINPDGQLDVKECGYKYE